MWKVLGLGYKSNKCSDAGNEGFGVLLKNVRNVVNPIGVVQVSRAKQLYTASN